MIPDFLQAQAVRRCRLTGDNFVRSGNPNGAGLPAWEKWSNEAGESKVVTFDADYDEPIIEMSNEEVTVLDVYAGIGAAVAGMPAEVQGLPYYFLWH